MVDTFRPASLQEALEIRQRHGAIPFAGGTDLMVKLRRGAGALPAFDKPVLFLDRCPELLGVRARGNAIEIGAMTDLASIGESPLVHPELRRAVLQMGGPALRNKATVGGNLCNASPAADMLPFLYAFSASVRLASITVERVVPISELIRGPGIISLWPEEILTSLLIPKWRPRAAFWRKVGTRKANALSKVSIAAFAELNEGIVSRARIALGAVAPTVLRLPDVEALLEGAVLGDLPELSTRAHRLAAAAVRPIDDQRSTAEYRSRVASGLVEYFVEHVLVDCLR